MAKRRSAPNLGQTIRSGTVRKNVLSALQKDALRAIAPIASAKKFYLAGGMALALQIQHRRSRDFDFFSPVRFDDPTNLVEAIKSAGIEFEVRRILRGTVFGIANGVEVSFIEYLYPLLNPVVRVPKYAVEMVDPVDIAAMKANALIQRGIKRDFVDIYALLKSGVSIAQMIDAFKTKYGINNPHSILLALNYFDEAENGAMPEMIWPIDWKEIKITIQKAVFEFTKNNAFV